MDGKQTIKKRPEDDFYSEDAMEYKKQKGKEALVIIKQSVGNRIDKIIKVHFTDDTLQKAFKITCYNPATKLMQDDKEMIVKTLLNLCTQIEQAQKKNLSETLRPLFPGSLSLLRHYISWISNQSWIDYPQIKMFDINDKRFFLFRREQAKEDNQERDALTGKSYMRD